MSVPAIAACAVVAAFAVTPWPVVKHGYVRVVHAVALACLRHAAKLLDK